jgi:hypothetical protein
MTIPVRLQLSRKKGFNLQAHSLAVNGLPAVNCARPSGYGNPFVLLNEEGWPLIEDSRDGSAWGVGRDYLEAAKGNYWNAARNEVVSRFRAECIDGLRLEPLRGNNLACWCAPGLACHVDVLLDLANRPQPSPAGDLQRRIEKARAG